MLEKTSEKAICIKCTKVAEPDTNPPLCKECSKLVKEADNKTPETLRELIYQGEDLWQPTPE